MKRHKVLRIITRLNIGGPAVHAMLLDSELSCRNFDSVLVTGRVGASEGDMSYLLQKRGNSRVISIPQLVREPNLKNDLLALWKLFRLIRKEKPDIVHTHMAKAGALGRMAALFTGVPVRVHTFHGNVFNGYFTKVESAVFFFIEKVLALFTHKIITISTSQLREIVHSGVTSEDRCEMIPLGFDLSAFLGAQRHAGRFKSELGLIGEVSLIGIIGRLTAVKNHQMFLEAAHLISSSKGLRDKVKFVIVGDGELRQQLREKAEALNITENVIFTGWRADLDVVYADLDVVVLTSLNEGTPVSIIEAMASAKPVIATDVGGVRDLLGSDFECAPPQILAGRGVLIKSNDVKGFAEAVVELLNDPKRAERMGRAGREFARAAFSGERLVDDVESLYRGLLAEHYKRKRKE